MCLDFFIFPSKPTYLPLFDEDGTLFNVNITGFSEHESYVIIRNVTLILTREESNESEYYQNIQFHTVTSSKSYLPSTSFYSILLPVNVDYHAANASFLIDYEYEGTEREKEIVSSTRELDFYELFAGL